MPCMRIVQAKASLWGLPDALPGVLRQAGAERAPQQEAGSRHARCYRSGAAEPWPGASVGVRAPWPGETPLNGAEIVQGLREGIL